jgi:hypothetical protein
LTTKARAPALVGRCSMSVSVTRVAMPSPTPRRVLVTLPLLLLRRPWRALHRPEAACL